MLTKVNDVIFNVLISLTCTCPSHFENSSVTHAQATCKANISHLDESIAALWVQISFEFIDHPCRDVQEKRLNV